MNSVFHVLRLTAIAAILLSAVLLSGCSEKKQAGPPAGAGDQQTP